MELLRIKITGECSEIIYGVKLLCEKLGVELTDDGMEIETVPGCEFLNVFDDGEKIIVSYGEKIEFFRGLAIAVGMIRGTLKEQEISERKQFNTCGVMFDVSRNMVITVDTAKNFIEYMALMGLNMMMLYTEDTYKMEKYPYFGYMRGAYTKEELKEIDSYALIFGIEVVGCIQTLSHLQTALRWDYAASIKDTDSTLYVGNKDTYDFIEEMFKTMSECFTSKRIHIGLDEAQDVGLGIRLKKEGYTKGLDLVLEHLNKVCSIAEKYGFEPMMWSDMFFKFGKIGGDYDYTSQLPDNVSNKIPKNIEMVYWDYCLEDSKITESFLRKHSEFKRNTVFAGGIWTWNRVVVNYDKTFSASTHQLTACKKMGVKDVFVTIWNNSSSLYNLYSVLPCMQLWAEHMYDGNPSSKKIEKMFEVCTGENFKEFMALGLDDFSKEDKDKYMEEGCCCINSSTQFFLNDILTGLFDKTLSEYDFKSHYLKYASMLNKISGNSRFEMLFKQAKILCDIVLRKSSMGLKHIYAYKNNDIDALGGIVEELKILYDLYEQYHNVSYDIWHSQNKPFGWEGSDMVIASAKARVKTAIKRIEDYINGKLDSLPEFEEERLHFYLKAKPLTESGLFIKAMSAAAVWN